MNTNAIVITLRRSTSRAAQVRKIIDTCPLRCEIWDATDGSRLTVDQIRAVYRPKLHLPSYPFKLGPGEIGCFLSHRRVWQKMIDESIPRLLVVEDDVEFLPNFGQALADAVSHAPDSSYVQFQVRDVRVSRDGSVSTDDPKLVRPRVVPLRTSAQLVTLGAAQRLLEFTQRFDRPVDAAIQMAWMHGANVLVSQPRSVIEVSGAIGGSTIGAGKTQKPLLKTIRRELNRALYRYRIATKSNRHAA